MWGRVREARGAAGSGDMRDMSAIRSKLSRTFNPGATAAQPASAALGLMPVAPDVALQLGAARLV